MYICPISGNCRKKKNSTLNHRMQYCSKKYEECEAFKKKKDSIELKPIPRYDYKD